MKKRRLRYDRISLSILVLILIISFFLKIPQIMSKNKIEEEVVTETRINEIREDETKVIETETDPSRLCSLSSITCEVESETDLVKKISAEYDVDWKLIESIVLHETGNRTSAAYINLNNVGGLMGADGLMRFNSVEESYKFMIRAIRVHYLDKGLTTIEKIQKKYAPIKAKNDPNNLNSNWISGVTYFYENL